MTIPLSWIRKVTSVVPELQAIPLFGKGPSFDWKSFSSALAERFSAPHFSLRTGEQTWREADATGDGLGKSLITYPLVVTPLGTLFWLMSQQDMEKLTAWLLKPGAKAHPLTSDLLQEGFYRFLVLETLDVLQKRDPLQSFTLHLSEEERPLETPAFCIDVEIEMEPEHSCWGRLAIPNHFRTAWVHHFERAPSEYIPTELSRHLELSPGIKVGSFLLSQSEWESVKEGDFIALEKGGVAMLCLGSIPLFNVKIHHNKISLVDYAFYDEENMSHSKSPEEESVSLKDLPLSVTVEIARLKMTLDQLMHLKPGNTLELPIHPEQSVSLTVNGEKVGRGELVHLGETLGLRILEIG